MGGARLTSTVAAISSIAASTSRAVRGSATAASATTSPAARPACAPCVSQANALGSHQDREGERLHGERGDDQRQPASRAAGRPGATSSRGQQADRDQIGRGDERLGADEELRRRGRAPRPGARAVRRSPAPKSSVAGLSCTNSHSADQHQAEVDVRSGQEACALAQAQAVRARGEQRQRRARRRTPRRRRCRARRGSRRCAPAGSSAAPPARATAPAPRRRRRERGAAAQPGLQRRHAQEAEGHVAQDVDRDIEPWS